MSLARKGNVWPGDLPVASAASRGHRGRAVSIRLTATAKMKRPVKKKGL